MTTTHLPLTVNAPTHLPLTVNDNPPPGMHKPDVGKEHAEVTYSIPGNSTGLKVRAFKVDTHTPERWVKYEVLYHYRVQMFPDLSID